MGGRLGESLELSNASFSRRKKNENALMRGRVKRESFENTDGIFKNCFPVQNHRKLIKDPFSNEKLKRTCGRVKTTWKLLSERKYCATFLGT